MPHATPRVKGTPVVEFHKIPEQDLKTFKDIVEKKMRKQQFQLL